MGETGIINLESMWCHESEKGVTIMSEGVVVANRRKIAETGKAIYDQLRPELEEEHLGEFVAIDIETGDYFVGETLTEADAKARQEYPDRVFYVVRIGRPYAYAFR